ncbi:MAG: hypothetical protein JWM03_890 [Rhodocyclales bacterium]|nr:hypothetical protein [Rhodocyclales bacterium]MDB5888018.1 hypothetical protein [Rhodocyclales bacterium]
MMAFMFLHVSFKKDAVSTYAAWRAVLLLSLLSGCATTHKPEELRVPEPMTCIYLQTPMSFFVNRGLFNVVMETRLERGPYIAEREDTEGTFYRAPPGGFSGWPYSIQSADIKSARDGGFWIPHDRQKTPRLYSYFSTAAVPPSVPSENINCSSFAQIKDPLTSKLNLTEITAEGAVGGAIGGVIGRSMNPHSGMSYGQAAGVGAVGGALGMAIVGAIINADVGKIILYPWEEGPEIDRLRKLASQAVKVKELSVAVPGTVPESVNR